ncbi:sulfite exporter TauE/SafE family protein [Peptococcaceae bacterium]|nr:sulfite exporter TauE/SafE family protein [Peptococcaceae bacterium]
MTFNVSGVKISPVIPVIVAFLIACVTTSAGVSGAFLLLPFQISVLGFVSPAVSPTNLLYNIVAIPGGLYKYIKEKRMLWPLFIIITAGTLPGVFIGAWIRIKYLPDPALFKIFVGLVLLYLGFRILHQVIFNKKKSTHKTTTHSSNQNKIEDKAHLPKTITAVQVKKFSIDKIEYTFQDKTFNVSTRAVFILSFIIGIVGSIYGIGGGAIIAPFLVSVFNLPVYTIAGAALAGTFIASMLGILAFKAMSVSPDWLLGILFGIGGLMGTYVGASIQKYLPEKVIKLVLGSLVILLAFKYIL